MSLQDIKKSKKTTPKTKGYFERKSDQKKAVQEYFKNKNKNKKETADRAPGSEGYKPTKTDMGPNMSQVNKPERGKRLFKDVKIDYKPRPKPEGNIASRVDNSDNTRIGPNTKNTPTKKEMTMMEKAKDIIGVGREATEKEKMGRALQDNARKSMGMKKGGAVKHRGDGCCMKGKTKGRMV